MKWITAKAGGLQDLPAIMAIYPFPRGAWERGTAVKRSAKYQGQN